MTLANVPSARATGEEAGARPYLPGWFAFGTKAETLERLRERLTDSVLCEQEVFAVSDWRRDPAAALDQVMRRFLGKMLAVRSSCRREDTNTASQAGVFASVLNVECALDDLSCAIERVIASYGRALVSDDQILIQPMVADVRISGVIFSYDLTSSAPYFVVNYDDFSGRTDTVTGGAVSKLLYVERAHYKRLRSTRFRRLIETTLELERITGCASVDIEFCIDAAERVYILQVRPLTRLAPWPSEKAALMRATLETLRDRLADGMKPARALAGATTIYGEMPDWNPAEMIGCNPTPLAASLYSHLITDHAWATARAEMGYRHVRHPLMLMLIGRPYIDVRLSLNSFLPASLPDQIAGPIVDYQLDQLRANRHFHDKIEFEIALTCWDCTATRRLAAMTTNGISGDTVRVFGDAVHRHTVALLASGLAEVQRVVHQLAALDDDLGAAAALSPSACALRLVDGVVVNGTVPFAKLARHAFIAMSQLRSLVQRGAIGEARAGAFMRSIRTVAAELVDDMAHLATGTLDRAAFLARYGHLRPGTYDIRVPRYDETPERYLDFTHAEVPRHLPFALASPEQTAIEALLRDERCSLNVEELFVYMRAAIIGREFAKFRFSRNVSEALRALCAWGDENGIPRDDLAFLDLGAIRGANEGTTGHGRIAEIIKAGRARQTETTQIRLPALITEPDEAMIVRMPMGRPTYITRETVMARPVALEASADAEIDGCIVLIESADPGFDWIFGHPIAGLITKYGGANSHMAIRCAEFGLPAAIGCGERTFDEARGARVVVLDCASQVIRTQHGAAMAERRSSRAS